jgi:hypothetical protein
VLQELAKGRLGLKEQVIAPLQGHEPCARDAGRHAATGFERDTGIIARMQHERWHGHPREQCGDIVWPFTSRIRAATSGDTVMRCSWV